MADAPTEPTAPNPEPAADPVADNPLSFIPETFRTKEGAPDPGAFVQRFEELSAADSRRAEMEAALPTEASGYQFEIPDDLIPESLRGNDKDGNPLIPRKVEGPHADALREIALKHKLPPEAANEIVALQHKIAFEEAAKMDEARAEQLKSLGDHQSRHADVSRKLSAIMPQADATALMEDLTSAAAFKAVERLLSRTNQPKTVPGAAGVSTEGMTPYQKLELANSRATNGGRR